MGILLDGRPRDSLFGRQTRHEDFEQCFPKKCAAKALRYRLARQPEQIMRHSEMRRRQYSRAMPDSLRHRIDLFRSSGLIFRTEDELFDVSNSVAVFLGQAVTPLRHDPRADTMSSTDLRAMMTSLRTAIDRTAMAMPMQADHISAIGVGAQAATKTATC